MSSLGITGEGTWEVHGADGQLKASGTFRNLITQVGDQYYGERAALTVGFPNQVTGMRLGTGTTAPSKTGSGASIVNYVNGSNRAMDSGFPASALDGTARRVQWKVTWPAGTATANGIAEVVITNETPLTDAAGAAPNTISRAIISPAINKLAGDALTVTWNHRLEGA